MKRMKCQLIYVMVVIIIFNFSSCRQDDEETGIASFTIRTVMPESGSRGEVVIIKGKGFKKGLEDQIVSFNAVTAKVIKVEGDSALSVIVPSGATTGEIEVAYGGAVVSGPVFTIKENLNPPVITGISVLEAEIGEVITIKGTNFNSAKPNSHIVTVGGFPAKIGSVTSTELEIAVPAIVPGNNKEVKIVLDGAMSNKIGLDVKGIAGNLYWYVHQQSNVPDNYPQYIYNADADGNSTQFKPFAISEETDDSKALLKYGIAPIGNGGVFSNAFPTVFDQTNDALLTVNKDRNEIVNIKKGWKENDFMDLYKGAELGYNFGSVINITSQSNSDDFYFDMIDPFTGMPAIFKGSKSGMGIAAFSSSNFVGIQKMTHGGKYLYITSPINWGSTVAKLMRLDFAGDGTPEPVDLLSIVNGTEIDYVYDMVYSKEDHILYFLYGSPFSSFSLYSLNEDTNEVRLITSDTEIKPLTEGSSGTDLKSMEILQTPTGPKLFYLKVEYENNVGLYTIYMVNLKSANPIPIKIYSDANYLSAHPENLTFSVSRIFVDNN